MELERDDIVVTYGPSEISVYEILKACEDSGFPATVVNEPSAELLKAESSLDVGDDPGFYVRALEKAREEHKPLILDFSADWCAPCQQMFREVFPDPRVAELLKRFIFVTIDTDEYTALTRKFGVAGMPDIRILNPDGIEIRQLLGVHSVEEFSTELSRTLEELDRQSDKPKD